MVSECAGYKRFTGPAFSAPTGRIGSVLVFNGLEWVAGFTRTSAKIRLNSALILSGSQYAVCAKFAALSRPSTKGRLNPTLSLSLRPDPGRCEAALTLSSLCPSCRLNCISSESSRVSTTNRLLRPFFPWECSSNGMSLECDPSLELVVASSERELLAKPRLLFCSSSNMFIKLEKSDAPFLLPELFVSCVLHVLASASIASAILSNEYAFIRSMSFMVLGFLGEDQGQGNATNTVRSLNFGR